MQFHFHANQSHFHNKGFALRLALKQRHKGTRKWPVINEFRVINTVSANFNLLCERKKATGCDEKDTVGTKGTKQGYSGQKEKIGTIEVFFSFKEVFSGLKSR